MKYVRLAIWQRHCGGEEYETIYKLPDGTEYYGAVYGLDDSMDESEIQYNPDLMDSLTDRKNENV